MAVAVVVVVAVVDDEAFMELKEGDFGVLDAVAADADEIERVSVSGGAKALK